MYVGVDGVRIRTCYHSGGGGRGDVGDEGGWGSMSSPLVSSLHHISSHATRFTFGKTSNIYELRIQYVGRNNII